MAETKVKQLEILNDPTTRIKQKNKYDSIKLPISKE